MMTPSATPPAPPNLPANAPLDLPPDEEARQAIINDIESTIFVEAGAGTGKTTALVQRILKLIEHGTDIRQIAAITFTEKAATELRVRIRQQLQESISTSTATDTSSSNLKKYQKALVDLDSATISTLHSFAQQILAEHALEAGLPLQIEVLDNIGTKVDLQQEWDNFLASALLDQKNATFFQTIDALEIKYDQLLQIASNFRNHWDQLTEPTHFPSLETKNLDLKFLSQADNLLKPDIENSAEIKAELGKTRAHYRTFADWDFADLAEMLYNFVVSDKKGGDTVPEKVALLFYELLDLTVDYLVALLSKFTLDQVQNRKQKGVLDFHDLLVMARGALLHPEYGEKVRAQLHRRYTHLLIDEFQDTDPIQIELAVLIASETPINVENNSINHNLINWKDISVPPGRLFLVGDPKQSIYRFRRADISIYLEAAEHFGPAKHLTANWRSSEPILQWINHVFGQLILQTPGSQPNYTPLNATQQPDPADPGPPVMLFGEQPHSSNLKIGPLRQMEANDIAEIIRQVINKKWLVSQKGQEARPATFGDICVLTPKRSNLPFLEKSLAEADIPYQVEVSDAVFNAPEIRDLLSLLIAIDDPTDELHVVSALRTEAFGCSDTDLYTFRQHGGKWNYLVAQPDVLRGENQHPVVEAFRWLSKMHQISRILTPTQVIDQVIEQRHLMELALTRKHYRDIWRKIRQVSNLANEFTEQKAGTLRQFLLLIQQLGKDNMRLSEDITPEYDNKAIRIMTIHAAKGLEFPIVILANTSMKLTGKIKGKNGDAEVLWGGRGKIDVHFKQKLASKGARDETSIEILKQQDADENLRKLYVACTRARDHLIVSLHRTEPSKKSTKTTITWAEKIAEVMPNPADYDAIEIFTPTPNTPAFLANASDILDAGDIPASADAPATDREDLTQQSFPEDFTEWESLRRGVLKQASIPSNWTVDKLKQARAAQRGASSIPPTSNEGDMADGKNIADDKDIEIDRESSIGRGGEKFGSALHAVMQYLDLERLEADTPTLVAEPIIKRYSSAFDLSEAEEQELSSLVAQALNSPCLRKARQAKHYWKEVNVSALEGENLIGGFIDLAYQDADGKLVIVDYKTNKSRDPESLRATYQMQMGVYAKALEQATGLLVESCVLLAMTREGQYKGVTEVEIKGVELAESIQLVEEVLAEATQMRSALGASTPQ